MKIAIVQSDLFWERPEDNRIQLQEYIRTLEDVVDMIVLPEMFSTGFTMNPVKVSEEMDGETITWMKSLAKEKNAALVGSLIIRENENYYNRLLFIHPSGKVESYDKRHLFTLAGEDQVYSRGTGRVIITYRGFNICPLICYDLRFPVFSRNTDCFDILLYVASWPEARITAWDSLLKARAIENQCYVIAVNRVGIDGKQIRYNGHSQVINALGDYLLNPNEETGVFVVNLVKEELVSTREKFDFLADRDSFILSE